MTMNQNSLQPTIQSFTETLSPRTIKEMNPASNPVILEDHSPAPDDFLTEVF